MAVNPFDKHSVLAKSRLLPWNDATSCHIAEVAALTGLFFAVTFCVLRLFAQKPVIVQVRLRVDP
jgi:hypothetical protein